MKSSAKSKTSKLTKSSKGLSKYPRKEDDVFVTQKMLYQVRDELIAHTEEKFQEVKSEIHIAKSEFQGVKSEIHGLKSEVHELKYEFHGLKSEIHSVKSEIHSVKSEVHELKSEMHGLKSQMAQFEQSMHRIVFLAEEQNNRNKIVLEGLLHLSDRQDRIEKKASPDL